ncbi:MAG TPA: FecR domain-containing protein, partial [Chitinophagaceae bacterium]|nr:FecR domain-containing protein [Chitinophagaceae bacterium]
TLLEGRVKVSRLTSHDSRLTSHDSRTLLPGQQSQLSGSGGAIRVEENADIEQAVAWKNGMQSFRNADIQAIMRQVGRWYNVQVEFQGSIPPVEMTGKIPRTISLKKVLEALELNSNLHFKLDNGVVTVTP